MKDKIYKVLHVIFLFLIATMIVAALYMINNLSSTNFEEFLFELFSSNASNTDFGTVLTPLKICTPIVLTFMLILFAVFYGITINKFKVEPLKALSKHKGIYTILLFIIALVLILYSIHFFEYIINQNTESNFIEENFVDPKGVTISFEKKQNLIFIFVESLENTLFTKTQGGNWNYEVIPELYNLGQDETSISFETTKGMKMLHGSSWTSASLVSNNTGVPLKVIPNSKAYKNNLASGSYSLGELLMENGYYNEVISSANTSFGSIDKFYKKHGNFEIIDIDSLQNYGLNLEEKDKGNWGFNDNYLFKTAKERLNIISKNDKPFNLQLITVDTHFFDGFISDYSEKSFKNQYENAYATTSRLINNFVDWVKEQPFYEDTTIVIMGDHLTMQSKFINNKMFKDRSIYCCIINSYNKNTISKNRLFTSLDTYPTVVSAIGGKIDGDKLGLGVNLFSNKKTLAEEYGIERLDEELQKRSSFYNKKILGIK